MKQIFRLYILVFSISFNLNPLLAQWVQTNGPYGGDVKAFAVSLSNAGDTNLFAATWGGGVFRSSDNGTSWIAVNSGLTTDNIISLAVSSRNLFAGTDDGGVFLSTNSGTSWTAVNTGLTSMQVSSLVISGQNVFAGTNYGVFLSTNNGMSWTSVSSGLPNTYIEALAVSGTNLFAGTYKNGVFLSTNNGTSWVYTGLTNQSVYALALSDTNLFAGCFGGGIFLSTDNGINWAEKNNGLTNTAVDAFVVSPNGAGGKNIFAGSDLGGVFLSTDNGTNWIAVNTGLTNKQVSTLAISGTNLFAGTTNGGLFLSTNNGTNWTAIDSGLTSTYVDAFAVFPNSTGDTSLFAGTWYSSIFESTNNGATWIAAHSGVTGSYIDAFTVSSSEVFVASENGVFLSTNSGASWIPVNTGLTNTNVSALVDISAGGGSEINLFAGTFTGGVFISTNNGTSWTAVNTGLTNPDILALGVSGKDLFAGTDSGGIFLSTDYGTSWSAINTGLTKKRVRSFAVSGSDIFAAIYGGGVFLSTNNGTNWTAVNTGLTNTYVSALILSDTNLFAGTNNGIFLSTNKGTSWNAVSDGLPNGYNSNYSYIEGFGSRGGYLFAGTAGAGTWRRSLSEMVLRTITATSGSFGRIFPSGSIVVHQGSDTTFTIIPNTGYHVDSVFVDQHYIGAVTSYLFKNVAANHTIRATFAINQYTISAIVSPNGSISPSGTVQVQYGSSQAFIIRPDTGYHVDSVVVDGSYAGHDTIYTFTNVTTNHTILGVFRINPYTQPIAVRQGWSIISGYVSPQSVVLDSLFGPIRSDMIILKNGQGKTYVPSVPVNTIGAWNITEGYQLKMNATRTLPVTGIGIVPEQTPVVLSTGWSIIPYLRQSGMRVDSALTSIVHNVIIVKDQDGNAFIPSIPVNGIGSMKPGQGYQVKMTGLDTLLYPTNTFSFAKNIVEQRPISSNTYKPHYQLKHISDNNATIAFPQKVVNGMLKKGDEVGVFSPNGLLVGCGMYEGESFAVAVWGDDPTTPEIDGMKTGESYNIRFWDRAASFEDGVKNIQWSEGTSTYEVNGLSIAATIELEKPMMLLPDRVTLYQNYPNPFNPTTTVGFSIPKTMNVQIRIYNVLGELVIELANQQFETGYHELSFNSTAYPSGVYYCRIEANGVSDVKKMLFMK